jgi:hypothetical protein
MRGPYQEIQRAIDAVDPARRGRGGVDRGELGDVAAPNA